MKDPEHFAVDLDGTLAAHDGTWRGPEHIGKPIPEMVDRVKRWLKEGKKVTILTARANRSENIPPIRKWLKEHVGTELPVTNIKRPQFSKFYDDRAVQVKRNTGKLVTARKMALA